MKIIIITLIILFPVFCFSQTEFENEILLSTNRTSTDSIVFHFRFYEELDLEILIKDKNIIQYKLANNDKSLNIKSIYSLYTSNEINKLKPRCVTSYLLDSKDSEIYSKYFCDELVAVYDFNYEIKLTTTSQILELKFESDNTIKIIIINEDYSPRYGYYINLNESIYEFGELRSIKRINKEIENPEEPGIIYYEIIESNMDKYGTWVTKNFENELIKREEIIYENIIEIK